MIFFSCSIFISPLGHKCAHSNITMPSLQEHFTLKEEAVLPKMIQVFYLITETVLCDLDGDFLLLYKYPFFHLNIQPTLSLGIISSLCYDK